MSDEVPNLRGGHTATWAFILGPILGALGFFGALLWQAAKYPDRSEFNALRDRVESTMQTTALTEDRLRRVQDDVAGIRADVRAIRDTQHDQKRR